MSSKSVAVARSVASGVPRALFKRSLARCLWAIAQVWVGIILAWVAVGLWGPVAMLPAILLVGTLQYHLNVMGHDGLHFLLADRREVNDAVCRWLLHGPHGAPLAAMRRNHLNHHMHFGDTADLDRQYYDTRRLATVGAFWRWACGALVGGMTLPIVAKLLGRRQRTDALRQVAQRVTPRAAKDTRADLVSMLLSQGWIAAACWLATGWWYAYALLWLLPLLTVMVGLNAIRSCLEHANAGSGAPGSHSFVCGRVERFFLAPFHMNVHAEHHTVPAVPWHQLPALREYLQREGLYEHVQLHCSYFGRARQLASQLNRAASDMASRAAR